jgi:hypothetical protein
MSLIKDIFSGGAEGIFGGVAKAIGAFKADPTKVIELEAAVEQAKITLEGKIVDAESAVIAAVNQTMQAEAKSEHWLQWSWRPIFGMTGAGILINNYIFLPYLVKYGVVAIVVPTEVWLMIMAVLGVAAYTRGQEKIKKA